MKIVALNIQQGGGQRAAKIATYLTGQDPDFIVLSEYRNNKSGYLLRTRLLIDGFTFQHCSVGDDQTNGVLIASKKICSFISYASEIDDYPGAILKAADHRLSIYGVYLPHKKKHQLFPFLLDRLCNDTFPQVIIGDYNTGKNYIDQKGNSFWYSEYLFKMEDLEYGDAFRMFQGDVREYSWYSHLGNGYRYDHCYVSALLKEKIRDCYYDHSVRFEKLSDHSALILKLSDFSK